MIVQSSQDETPSSSLTRPNSTDLPPSARFDQDAACYPQAQARFAYIRELTSWQMVLSSTDRMVLVYAPARPKRLIPTGQHTRYSPLRGENRTDRRNDPNRGECAIRIGG